MYEDFVLLLKKSKFKKALDVLDIYLADRPEDVYLLTQKANILWNMNKYDDAYNCILQADVLSSGDGLLEFTAGRVLWSMAQTTFKWIFMDMAKCGSMPSKTMLDTIRLIVSLCCTKTKRPCN